MMAITPEGRRRLEEYRRAEEAGQLALPWGGRSPRDLTEAHKRFRLNHETAPVEENREEDARLDEQYRRFLHGS